MVCDIVSKEEAKKRLGYLKFVGGYAQNDFMQLIHNEEAHKKTLHPDPDYWVRDYFTEAKDIFDEYPDINSTEIFNWYLEDEKNRVRRIKWDVIPAEQYHNLLSRYMEMGEFARIPVDIVTSWYKKIKRNTVILYYLAYMYHRKQGFPFEIVPFETTDPVEAQTWLFVNTNFYNWARFENRQPAYTDRAFDELFPLLRQYHEGMESWEILILINKLLHVVHRRSDKMDFTLAFIEGGRKTCDRITNGE